MAVAAAAAADASAAAFLDGIWHVEIGPVIGGDRGLITTVMIA